jgi:hypothetical protein
MHLKFPDLKDAQGVISLLVAFFIVLVIVVFTYMIIFLVKINMQSGLHTKLAARAVETADVGVAQMISDIHRHAVDLSAMPVTTTYSLIKDPTSGATETVTVTIDTIPDINDVDGDGDTAEPETDLTGNIIYNIDSVSKATLSSGQEILKREVAARLSVINLASYNLFYVENDIWANSSTLNSGQPIMLDGPYHTNGDLALGGIIYFNNQFLPSNPGTNNVPGGTANVSYFNGYTVMSAGNIIQASGYPGSVTYTQNNQRGRLSNDGAYNVCPTATNPRGTWFDKAHGGFEIHMEPLDFVRYRGMAQVKLDINQLPNYLSFGSIRNSNQLVIDTGAGFNAVDIDLASLGNGTVKDICGNITNYENALTSEYGLVIFVKGPVAVHGKLASLFGAANNNKKVTIISTDTLDIIGDILYSGDPYMQILDSFATDANADDQVDNWNIDQPALGQQLRVDSPNDSPQIFNNPAPFKCMKVSVHKGATGTVTYSKHLNIVAPPAGINNNKVYVNVRAAASTDATAGVTATLQLVGSSGFTWTMGPIPINSINWRRLVLVDNATSGDTLSAADVQDIASNAGDNVRVIFNTGDVQVRNFYVDELCFAFGKSYPIDYATVNPSNDAIALISQGNMYENAQYLYNASPQWYSNWLYVGSTPIARTDSIKFFAVNGDYNDIVDVGGNYNSLYYDLRIDAFMYTSLTGSMFTVHTNRWLNMFTVFGATTSHRGGTVRAPVFNNVYDRNEASNVSKAIPVGTVLHTYQQIH